MALPFTPGQIQGGSSIVGLGLEAYGLFEGQKAAGEYNQAQTSEIQQQIAIENMKYQAQLLMNERQQRQNVRNVQRARSLGVAQATGSGSQFGSGLAGAQAGESAQGALNTLNLSQDRQIATAVHGATLAEDQAKIQMANAQRDLSTAQGWSSLGKDIVGAGASLAMFGG